MKQRVFVIAGLALLLSLAATPSSANRIVESDFDRWLAAQNPDEYRGMKEILSLHGDPSVTGPLYVGEISGSNRDILRTLSLPRVICHDSEMLKGVDRVLKQSGYPWNVVRRTTFHVERYWIWHLSHLDHKAVTAKRDQFKNYAKAVLRYVRDIKQGLINTPPPTATEFDLPAEIDFYAPPPDYVIEGYQNYKDSIAKYAAIETDFASGVLSIVPTDSLLDAIKKNAPREAFINKEQAAFQHEMRKFFKRGGHTGVMNTLTAIGFDTLKTGEYFFAVSLAGTVRFGRELLREEVVRIETSTGQKVPRANHAFLFPGEPILTAGAFFIKRDSVPRLVEVNAQSGHYFYSNLSPTVHDDIVDGSNRYLLTLGHFFNALDSLGVTYGRVLISKF